jgi:hypothetical protein
MLLPLLLLRVETLGFLFSFRVEVSQDSNISFLGVMGCEKNVLKGIFCPKERYKVRKEDTDIFKEVKLNPRCLGRLCVININVMFVCLFVCSLYRGCSYLNCFYMFELSYAVFERMVPQVFVSLCALGLSQSQSLYRFALWVWVRVWVWGWVWVRSMMFEVWSLKLYL